MLDSLGQYLQISLYIHLAGHEPPSVINEKKGGRARGVEGARLKVVKVRFLSVVGP